MSPDTTGLREDGPTMPAHHLLDANLSMTCTNCGGHTELTAPCIPARTYPAPEPDAGDVGEGLTEAERETLGMIVAAADDADQSLNDWHHCRGCPYQQQQPCACSGRVWLGDEMANAVAQIKGAAREQGRAEGEAAGYEEGFTDSERSCEHAAEWAVAVEGLADSAWRVTPCGCGHRADLHTMGAMDVSVCVGGLGLCGCDQSFVRIVQTRLRALLTADRTKALDAVKARAKAEALRPIRQYAEGRAITAKANGRDDRDWLDLLHLLDRADRIGR